MDTLKQPMFFGESLNISRDDIQKYPIFMKNFKQQVKYYWVPEEVQLNLDKTQFRDLTSQQQKVFEKNIAYQILLDSVQARSLSSILMPIVSLPELEQCIAAWSYMESVHSRSYQYLLKTVFNNPSNVFNEVLNDAKIKTRAESITSTYNDFAQFSEIWRVLGYGTHTINGVTYDVTEYNLKQKFYAFLLNVYFLESILFYDSFLCSWSFAENGLMTGNGKIISLIARDENLHTAITKNIITTYKTQEKDEVMARVIEDSDDLVFSMFANVISGEEAWIEYLFEDNPQILGLNEEVLKSYLYYLANKRIKNLGYTAPFADYKHNPAKWADKYLQLDLTQTMLQETEGLNYEAGNVTFGSLDINKFTLKGR